MWKRRWRQRCWDTEGQGEGQCGVGGELEIFFISEGYGIGHVSKTLYRINVHSFIVEVKLKRRWRPGRRGGYLTPPQEATQ